MEQPQQDAFERFWKAAEQLGAEGDPVTLRAVRRVAGGGSFRDISKALDSWRKRAQTFPPIPDTPPEDLIAVTQQLWRTALGRATQRIEAERTALALAVQEQEAKVSEIAELLQEIETEKVGIELELKESQDLAEKRLSEMTSLRAQVATLESVIDTRLQSMTRALPWVQEKQS